MFVLLPDVYMIVLLFGVKYAIFAYTDIITLKRCFANSFYKIMPFFPVAFVYFAQKTKNSPPKTEGLLSFILFVFERTCADQKHPDPHASPQRCRETGPQAGTKVARETSAAFRGSDFLYLGLRDGHFGAAGVSPTKSLYFVGTPLLNFIDFG